MRMRTTLLLVLLPILSGCLNDLGVAPADRLGELGNTEYAVLAAIVQSTIARPPDSVIVLRDSTDPGVNENDREGALTRVLSFVSRQVPSLTTETMQNFKTKNLTSTYIRDPQRIRTGCVHASRITRTLPWLEVSRVGFSADGQQALAYVGYTYGLDAGEGIYYVLSRQDGAWKVIGKYGLWVS